MLELQKTLPPHSTDAAVVGGGFIALEIAAALKARGYGQVYLLVRREILRSYLDEDMAEKVKAVSNQVKYAFALFNNHWQGYAPRNAVDMMKALQLPFKELRIQVPLDEDQEKL